MADADPSTLDSPAPAPVVPAADVSPPLPAEGAQAAAPESRPEPKDRASVIRAAMKASQEPADGKSIRDKMIERGVIRPADGRPRAVDGKFAPKAPAAAPQAPQGAAPAIPAPTAAQVAPVATVAPVALPMPKALKAELAAHWGKTPREMQEAIAKYTEDATKGIEKYRGTAQQAEAILNEFKPYEALIRSEGGTPQGAMRDLLNTSYLLRTGSPEKKAYLIAQTMQRFGINPEHVGAILQGGGQQPAGDPRYDALAQQFTQLQQTMQQREQAQYASVAEQFGATKPHWNLMRPHVADILSRGEIEGAENMTEHQILEAAYTKALEAYPVITQAEAEAKRQTALDEERKRANAAAQAARQAAVQVTGAPGGTAPAAFNPKDRQSVIRHALRTAQR